MAEASFKIVYEGEALNDHRMDVKELAPALLAVGELLEETNLLLNGGRAQVAVNIRAFSEGSFGVDLALIQNLAAQLAGMFAGQNVTGVANLLALVGFVDGDISLVALIKWLKNRGIKSVTRLEAGRVRIEIEQSTDTLEVPEPIIHLLSDLKVRKSLELIIKKPLEKEGIDRVTFKDTREVVSVSKEEAEYFSAPDLEEQLINEQEITTNLQIVNVAFQDGNKWRFYDGSNTFFAVVQDAAFLERVRTNEEAFAKDDLLEVRLVSKQFSIPEGIRTDYYVREVLNHRNASRQLPIPFKDDPEDR